ncbi:hypothetical protein PoB_006544100 [Plakobranchus ocellatus]|uniref:Uncharacterized protein n=1 Tax=Plakobranchus ocellatus TaxID=259542 RepID=A0AAV4D421_9GAST|nr:hypothetical protein PoB_006544100 [Plakobranchus ocellatus]
MYEDKAWPQQLLRLLTNRGSETPWEMDELIFLMMPNLIPLSLIYLGHRISIPFTFWPWPQLACFNSFSRPIPAYKTLSGTMCGAALSNVLKVVNKPVYSLPSIVHNEALNITRNQTNMHLSELSPPLKADSFLWAVCTCDPCHLCLSKLPPATRTADRQTDEQDRTHSPPLPLISASVRAGVLQPVKGRKGMGGEYQNVGTCSNVNQGFKQT